MAPAKEKFSIYVDESQQINLPTAPPVVAPLQQQKLPQPVLGRNATSPVHPKQSHLPQLVDRKKGSPPRYRPEILKPNERWLMDMCKRYTASGELSTEELRLKYPLKASKPDDKAVYEDLIRENELLKQKVMILQQQLTLFMQQVQEGQFKFQASCPANGGALSQPQASLTVTENPQHISQHQVHSAQKSLPLAPQPQTQQQQPASQLSSNIPNATGMPGSNSRQSLLPQCIQPTQTLEFNETSIYCAMSNAPSVVQDLWSGTFACNDRFTLPIDQSEYIRENIQTSTPASKRPMNPRDENKRQSFNRRASRQSVGAVPEKELSPIVETSRECNSKSSSSSSAMSTTPGATQKSTVILQPTIVTSEPDKPILPSNPRSYQRLIDNMSEPLSRRIGYFRARKNLPPIKPERTCVRAGSDEYLIVKEVSPNEKLYTAILMDDGSNESSTTNIPTKQFCVKVDQPPNEWLFYICNELQRRLYKRKCKPDIELSVMNANPAIIYNNGSIMIDEYTRRASLSQLLEACKISETAIPKSVSTFMTLELLHIIKQMHACEVIHMNIKPENIFITGCPSRDDILNVDERTNFIKLVGFDRAMDMRLLPAGTNFICKLDDLMICEMRDSKPWSWHIDWYGALDCIHMMMFGEKMSVTKKSGRWAIDKSFKGLPTNVWETLFDELLNIGGSNAAPKIDQSIIDLGSWVKANNSFILKQMSVLDEFFKELKVQDLNSTSDTNRSCR